MAKVLIVDDEKLLTDAYEIVLENAGYTVFVANDPAEGLVLAENENPNIILLDMLMPEMNGVEFLEALNKKKHSTKTKVVVFSNIENSDLEKAARKLGAIDYLLKVNYTPHEVADLVASILKK